MNNSDFKEYLSDNTGIDFILVDELFERIPDAFKVALTLTKVYGADKNQLGKLWGDYLGFAYVDPNSTIVNREFVDKLGLDFISKNKIMPLYKFGRAVTVCTPDPTNPYLQDRLEKMLGEIVSLVFCFPFDIENYLSSK